MSKSIPVKRKKRGRPATGVDPVFGLRIPSELIRRIDEWGAPDCKPLNRSGTIRKLIELGLTHKPPKD